MGITTQARIQDHWSTDWLFSTPGFRRLMTRARYMQLNSFLHFTDNEQHEAVSDDPLWKIRPLASILTSHMETVYVPGREIAIDESMVAYKGRLSFKQYIPSKRTRFGIKCWAECESKTGYTRHWKVYTGQTNDLQRAEASIGLAHRVVRDLTSTLHNSGHHLYIDNFYTSPALADELRQNGIGVCGTVRSNRQNLPQPMRTVKPRKHEPAVFWRRGELLASSWFDKRPVYSLSSIHPAGCVEKQVRCRSSPGATGQ